MNSCFKLSAALLAGAICAQSWAQAADKPYIFTPIGDAMIHAMSDNGLYAASVSLSDTDVDNPRPSGGSFIDLTTNTSTTISTANGWAEIGDIADNGIVVGSEGGKPGYWTPVLDTWTTFSVPKPWGGGSFMAVTPDARYAVGYYMDAEDVFSVCPMAYDLATGDAIELTNLPTVDMAGEDKHQNLFYAISPDGRYALGQMSQSYLLPLSLFSYVYDLQEQTWAPIGFDFNESTHKFTAQVPGLHFIDTQHMSCDGNWVTGCAYYISNGGQSVGGEEYRLPYRYHVPTGEFELFTATGDQDVAGEKITADGVVLGSSPAGNPYPTACIRSGNFFISLNQILAQVYGMSLYNEIGDAVTGSFQCLSADGLTAVMTTYDNCYVIRMPEPFVDAAARVDLLANYMPSIPSGTSMSAISKINITFDRKISVYGDNATASLLDGDGNLVRNSSGFQLSASNDHQLEIAFRTTQLKPGEKYTVVIPEGKVWLSENTSIKNKEIRLTYYGRNEGAVQPVGISPASGSAVAQFNSNPDYITVEFDCPVAIAPDAACTLFNADNNTVVANFLGSASDNFAFFYPAQTYCLYKGTNYKVVISEGAVTDISGAGPSEEIVLDYVGAYVRELSSDDTHIFNSNCSNYDYFLMWMTRFNEPAAIPSSWGFEADNAWLLLTESEDSNDACMASHSMFTPAGESDTWLVTPQLYIPDANAYLAFDAQSYLANKSDVLKVYVYCDDAVYNGLSDEIVEGMRADGDLVIDEVLTPGASQEGLSGDWQHFSVALDKYAGKNIYIAFVNNNYDQSAIFIDNIEVVRDLSFALTNQTPASIVAADEVKVEGLLSVASEVAKIEGIKLALIDAEGNEIDAIDDPDAVLEHGDTYRFAFAKALPLTVGKENAYSIEVVAAENTYAYSYTIKDLTFEPVKKVVLEECTGRKCGNCPLGILAIENLQSLYPDNFIPVTIRTFEDDTYGIGLVGYTDYLSLSAAPTGRINRGLEILSPAMQTSEGYTFYGKGIVESDGSMAYLWADAVQDELETPAEAAVDFTVTYDPATGEISVPCQVRFALDSDNRSISVFGVVIENDLPTMQLNYFYTMTDPFFGEWGAGGQYGQSTTIAWRAMDVARFTLGDSYAGTKLPESSFAAGETYTITLSGTVPDGRITNPDNCRVAVMIIDGGTQRIINANEVAFTPAGIGSIEADDANPVYYNLQGMQVANPERGKVYIRLAGNKATKILF